MNFRFSDELIHQFRTARSICVLTGAGISAESGVPTFRDRDGLWNRFRPEELANMTAFMSNPDRVWEWYSFRRDLIQKVNPNPGHFALVELEKRVQRFTLVTQNVDNLHRRAGSQSILEVHGNIEKNYCMECKRVAKDVPSEKSKQALRCSCGGLIRPDVVWFGELLPVDIFEKAEQAAQTCDVFVSVGTSTVVYPAASLPFSALKSGAFVVEINKEPTDLSHRCHESLLGPSGVLLPALVNALREASD